MYSLKCPVGEFKLTDGKNCFPFSVRKNPFNIPYEYCGKLIESEQNYEIVIKTENLTIGETYCFEFSHGNFVWTESDENTNCIAQTINGYSVGSGIYDFNENEKERQFVEKIPLDESKMKFYIVDEKDFSNGWKFKLVDKSQEEIVLKAAWVENGNFPFKICESALGFWLT